MTEIVRFASPGHPDTPKLSVFVGYSDLSPCCASCWYQTVRVNQAIDDQEKELERKLERALDALVWGRRQPDFSSDDRTKLLTDVTDARIKGSLRRFHYGHTSRAGVRYNLIFWKSGRFTVML
jgi:hypothetical protein